MIFKIKKGLNKKPTLFLKKIKYQIFNNKDNKKKKLKIEQYG
jgi:hypothetical protein